VLDLVEQRHKVGTLDAADRLVAERWIDQPPQDRHPLVECAQPPALSFQVVLADGGERVRLGGVGFYLGVLPRLGRIVAELDLLQRLSRRHAGIVQRDGGPRPDRVLGRLAVDAVAYSPAPVTARLQEQIQTSAVRYLLSGRTGLG